MNTVSRPDPGKDKDFEISGIRVEVESADATKLTYRLTRGR